jgi:hypothetical protein
MDSATVDQASHQFLDQWKRLVSTTNWEKGQIICNWREALRASDAPASEYSDEAWSRRVGNVTPQHVGRLRRAHERFAASRASYPGLYWSHFQAALDWDDAELWLEGAAQSNWSISEMREQRWEAMGGADAREAGHDDSLAAPWDEDADANDPPDVPSATMETVRAPGGGSSAAEEDEDGYDRSQFDDDDDRAAEGSERRAAPTATDEREQPFINLPPLPSDVNDAFEAYKLCILRHKLSGWQEIPRDDLLLSLESLKRLALAPSEA